MRCIFLCVGIFLSSGCVQVERTFSSVYPSGAVDQMVVAADPGNILYDGMGDAVAITIDGRSWATGSSEEGAFLQEETNEWSMQVEDRALQVTTTSTYWSAGVDLNISGPMFMDLNLSAPEGDISVYDVRGNIDVSGQRIVATGLSGIVNLSSVYGGIDAEVSPVVGDSVMLGAFGGPVVLRLPRDLPVDLIVYGDPEFSMNILDLGFTAYQEADGFFTAYSGEGSIPISVMVDEGDFFLLASD